MTAVSDNFDRANSTNLGASWTEVVGNWEIVSNKVQCNDDDGGTGYYLRYETDTGSSDMFSQAVTSSTQADSGSNTGLAVRMRSGANTSYQMTTRHAGDTIGVWRIVAGAESQQSWQTEAQAISVTINSGDTIRVEAVGSLIRGKVAGALVGICVDTNITDGQRAGLNGYNAVGTDVVEMDDFAGGGLIADGGLLAPIIVGISAQVTGTGTTLTPTVPGNIASGDLVVAHCTSRDAAQTMTNPGSEGWAAGPTPTQTGLEDAVFYKVWGLGGQTDDTTPTFSIGSGTAGWGVTLTVFRNPAHATAPWTSTSAAVVASGSQANASSATVTAPSVNHDGANRTVVRLFSSADDNALNTPSSGALAYGGAAYDSTTGNDFSQAMSLRENITVTTNTGTSTVTETVLGNDVNNGVTLVLAVPSAATVNATLAAALGGTATATAVPDHPATASASVGFTADSTATVDHPATLTSDLGALASATATVEHPALLDADLGGTATATAVRETAATAAADLGGVASAAAAPDLAAVLSAPLGASAAASATVTHPAVAEALLGFSASAEASVPGQPVEATLDSPLGGAAAAAAVVGHAVVAVADLGGSASAAAAPDRPAVLVATLGGTSTATAELVRQAVLAGTLGGLADATATVTHPAIAEADLGFSSAAVATVPPTADPNPTIGRLRDSGPLLLADPAFPRLREPR